MSDELHETRMMLQYLINKVNMVTAYWRHQGLEGISNKEVYELYEGQVEAEKFLRRPYHYPSCDTCGGYSAIRMTPSGHLRCDVCVRDAK